MRYLTCVRTAFCEVSQFLASQHSHRQRQDSRIVVHNLMFHIYTKHLKIGMRVCLVLSVCPQQIIIFVIVFAPLLEGPKRIRLVETISTRYGLSSTDQNW